MAVGSGTIGFVYVVLTRDILDLRLESNMFGLL